MKFPTRSFAAIACLAVKPNCLAATPKGPVTSGSPDQTWGVRRAVTAADRAAIAAYRSGGKAPVFSTNFESAAELTADWTLESDDNPTLKSCRRPDSVEASAAGLRLKTLGASTCRSAQWSTGHIGSKAKYGYGFFEARIRIADTKGINNAFWLTTDDNFEIDVAEATYPSYIHIGLQYWPPPNSTVKHAGMGWGASFVENLSYGFHDIGLLRRPNEMIFEVDGEPVAAVVTKEAVNGPANIRFSTALGDWAGGKVPDHPEGHNMVVQSFRAFALE
ncbi:glycoside hydrolase family 16 protein [Bradyrhizobium sp.]|uniref:glycoside hydrolase family 16 protein n=1 Tax=Bradyrhizobium sp. TaxID=376 RepID=UPI001DA86755|nr:glycoside hydrolase family 16 protein [Bradyrhizobium sp.]MBV8701898.1 glycoside hydrolase family 16 protein [Bradyrhizobium sp.]MBV8920946.1 glycoside hydrolase family 16 protein [Bradyrhizobium sp.]MBV9980678.1 glycoside hydrolase family 16 protein [Bradyrhizobium sp.]